jgi:hypothetical protein
MILTVATEKMRLKSKQPTNPILATNLRADNFAG